MLGGAGRARASSQTQQALSASWGPGDRAALLLPQPCSTWLPYITLLNPAAAWPQAAVQALCSGYQLAAARRADKGQFRARRSLRAPAPSTRPCGARGRGRQMPSISGALSSEGRRESGQSGALPALQGGRKRGFGKDRVLQEGIHAGEETLNTCFWPKSVAAESFSGNLQPS